MSRIDDPASRRSVPTSDEQTPVDEMRDPLTARLDGKPVDGDVAPMLPDLLTRPEAISGRARVAGLRPPRPTDAVDPPSPTEELQLLRRAESRLDGAAGTLPDARRAEAVDTLRRVLTRFRRLREQVVMRAAA